MNLSAAFIGLAFTAGSANAATITWSLGTFTDETSLQSGVSSAFNFVASTVTPGDLSVAGITPAFVKAGVSSSGGVTIDVSTGDNNLTSGANGRWNEPTPWTADANFLTIADSFASGPRGAAAFTINGLTIGVKYSIQIGAVDDGTNNTREMALSDTAFSGNTPQGSNTGYFAQSQENLITGVFTATGTSQTIYGYGKDIGGTTTRGFPISFMTVAVVPEPSAALLGGIGLLFLLRRRRV